MLVLSNNKQIVSNYCKTTVRLMRMTRLFCCNSKNKDYRIIQFPEENS